MRHVVAPDTHRFAEDPYSEKVTFSISNDEGATWSLPGVPHRDEVPGQHAFVSTFPLGDRLGLVWLDARRQTYVPPQGGKGKEKNEWLGSIGLLSTTIGADGGLGPEAVVDPVTCECCPTAAAVSGRGPVVVYRDRSDLPSGSGSLRSDQDVVRDIHLVRWQGGKWTAPKRVHADDWVFNGCPDNGPSVAARGDLVAVPWWTAPEGKGAVKVAFPHDAGDSFGPPVRVDEGFGLGQVTVALAEDGALVGWLESGHTQARHVALDRRPGPVTTLGLAAHHARLPRWPADGSGFVAAWNEGGEDDVKHVRLARVSLD